MFPKGNLDTDELYINRALTKGYFHYSLTEKLIIFFDSYWSILVYDLL